MTTIYDRLNIKKQPLGNNIIDFSANTKSTLNGIPAIIPKWQEEDIGNNNTTGYTTNKLYLSLSSAYDTANAIYENADGVNSLITIKTSASSLGTALANFRNHTDRLSGVTEPNGSTFDKPHYSTAVSAGKVIMLMTNKSDSVENNSPIIGSFSSLMCNTQIQSYKIILEDDYVTVNNSIYYEIVPYPPSSTKESNLSNAEIIAITSDLTDFANFMNGRRANDETFFTNSVGIVEQYKDLKKFTSMGQTELQLVNDFIGTDKLKSRIN